MQQKFLRITISAILTSALLPLAAGEAIASGIINNITSSMGIELGQVKPVLAKDVEQKRAKTLLAQTSEEQTRIAVYQKASPAVVTIRHSEGSGSGFIVSPDGLVLTNAHVLEGAPSTVRVVFKDGKEVLADVIGVDKRGIDLAALKIRNQSNLPTVSLAPPGAVQVGQSVYAIGSPFGMEDTFTSGVVSRIDRRRNWIQHDAPINPGNSGGPLLNSKAEVIGVNTALFNPTDSNTNIGISLAIAVSEVQPFLVALQQGGGYVAQQPQQPDDNSTTTQQLPLDGKTVTATLKKGDEVLPNNTYYHTYTFKGRAGQQ
ncbi:MAG: trypsin-like peptidase domain-containing protein, partial [Crinalium sp.]